MVRDDNNPQVYARLLSQVQPEEAREVLRELQRAARQRRHAPVALRLVRPSA